MDTFTDNNNTILVVEMLKNFNKHLPALETLARAFSYMMGILCMVRALYKLKVYGEARTMMSSSTSITPVLLLFLAGSAFMFLPGMLKTMMMTFFVQSSPLDYPAGPGDFDIAIRVIINIVRLVGIIAFIKGWLILSKVGDHSGQASVGKGLTHIIGGIFAANIYQVTLILFSSFGLSFRWWG